MNGDLDEPAKIISTPASALRKHSQQINRRRAFFRDDVLVAKSKINSTIDSSIDESSSGNVNHVDDNPAAKALKRKVVSFSAMPFEKKVADGERSLPSPPARIELARASLASDCLRYMQEGSDFVKLRSYARQFHRLYKLNGSLTAISWYPSAKKPSKAMSEYALGRVGVGVHFAPV